MNPSSEAHEKAGKDKTLEQGIAGQPVEVDIDHRQKDSEAEVGPREGQGVWCFLPQLDNKHVSKEGSSRGRSERFSEDVPTKPNRGKPRKHRIKGRGKRQSKICWVASTMTQDLLQDLRRERIFVEFALVLHGLVMVNWPCVWGA